MKTITPTCFHDTPNGGQAKRNRAASGNKSALAGGGGAEKPDEKPAEEPKKTEKTADAPIKTFEEFNKEFQRDLVSEFEFELSQGGDIDSLSVGALREKYKGRLTDEEFDDHLRELRDRDVIRLGTSSPGEKNNFPDKGGIKTAFGDVLSVAQVDPTKIDKSIKPKPPTGKNPITSQKQFESAVEKAMKSMDADRSRDGFYEIHEIRKHLGDNVTRGQFSKMMLEMQASGKWQLEKGNVSEANRQQVRDSITTKISGLRFYIKPAS